MYEDEDRGPTKPISKKAYALLLIYALAVGYSLAIIIGMLYGK